MQNRARLGRDLDLDLIRRLAVMKTWVDTHGLKTAIHAWRPAHEPRPLDVEHWLRERTPRDFDDEFIGLLATPPPALDELGRAMAAEYGFLRDLTDDEKQLALCSGHDKPLLLHMLDELPNTTLPQGTCS